MPVSAVHLFIAVKENYRCNPDFFKGNFIYFFTKKEITKIFSGAGVGVLVIFNINSFPGGFFFTSIFKGDSNKGIKSTSFQNSSSKIG